MQYTKNIKLKKPDGTDRVRISDINENMDKIDEKLGSASIQPGTGEAFSYDGFNGTIILVNPKKDDIFAAIDATSVERMQKTYGTQSLQGILVPAYSCIPIPVGNNGLKLSYMETNPLIHSKTLDSQTVSGSDSYGKYYTTTYTFKDENTCGIVLLESNPLCFLGDTLITMYDGSKKRIDEIEIGDVVLSYDFENDIPCANVITRTDREEMKAYFEWHKYTLSDGTILKIVHTHAFFCEEEQAFKYIDKFEIGEHLLKEDGVSAELVNIELVRENVYHFTIAGDRGSVIYANGCLAAEWEGVPGE